MKTLAISGIPVSVVIYTETGLSAPQKISPKQRISSTTANTKANQNTYATFSNHVFERHSPRPAESLLFRRAKHRIVNTAHVVDCRQPQAERISQARPALYPV